MSRRVQITDDSEQIRKGIAKFPWIRLSLFLLICFCAVFPFTKTGKDIVSLLRGDRYEQGKADGIASANLQQKKQETVTVPVQPKPVLSIPEAKPTPDSRPRPPKRKPIIAVTKDTDIRKTVRGFNLNYKAEFLKGELATRERKRNDSYVADFTLKVKLPKPATTIEELEVANPRLSKILPGLQTLVDNAKVSEFYKILYNEKASELKKEVLRLGQTLTMHNFYDCQTMLEVTHPTSKRKVFLLQGDMDVVTDGSDGDRLSVMADEVINSTYYQPFTSYSWLKKTDIPNPMIAGWEQRIKNANRELANPTTSTERRNWLKARIKNKLKPGILDMKRNSFLIAKHDPFIVVPYNMFLASSRYKHIPRVGDYAAVIYGDKVYPAIVGDGGPKYKVGEGSLRLARTINPAASSMNRPVSSLGVTYVIFPGTCPKPRVAPDYKIWHDKCAKLLNEIGGLGQGYDLHQWENTLPQPTSTPEPSTSPDSTPVSPDSQ